MKTLLLSITLTFFAATLSGQNLVVNPSFEDTVSCPMGPDEVYKCFGWQSYRETPDYMNACSNSSMSVPINWGGYQKAASGNAYAAFAGFFSEWMGLNRKEYVGGHLSQPLTIGTKYYVSFKISLTLNNDIMANCACNKIGAMFSTTPYDVFNPAPITNNPPVHSDSLITDSVNWTSISGSFIADSAYQYIIIGNFYSSYKTDTLVLNDFDGSHLCYGAYYYLDDVCVSTDSLNCNIRLGLNTISQNIVVRILPNPFSTQLTISLEDNEQTTISLYSFLGQKVLQQTFTNNTTINTEQLAEGIYIYELRNEAGTVTTGKVVKH
jgi:hypothetical protein